MKMPGVYIFTNRVNGKQYVGMTRDLTKRINGHATGISKSTPLIHQAIQSHGIENFTVETIECPNEFPLCIQWLENALIEKLNTLHPNGYNLTIANPSNRRCTKVQRRKRAIWRTIPKEVKDEILFMRQHKAPLSGIAERFNTTVAVIKSIIDNA